MLVLSRHQGESIIIDHGRIKVTVLEVRGSKVRLGVIAPSDVTVDREEVYEAKEIQARQNAKRGFLS